MKYRAIDAVGAEPEQIRVGDMIWWNEGVCVGFVEAVMEQREVFESWGLDDPSIAVTNLHPLQANEVKHEQHIGLVTNGGTVVYSADDLEDEGVGLLSEHERSELDWAISEARSKVSPEYSDLPFSVSAVKDMVRCEEDWHIHFVDNECRVKQSVIFPFRPNTRTG